MFCIEVKNSTPFITRLQKRLTKWIKPQHRYFLLCPTCALFRLRTMIPVQLSWLKSTDKPLVFDVIYFIVFTITFVARENNTPSIRITGHKWRLDETWELRSYISKIVNQTKKECIFNSSKARRVKTYSPLSATIRAPSEDINAHVNIQISVGSNLSRLLRKIFLYHRKKSSNTFLSICIHTYTNIEVGK